MTSPLGPDDRTADATALDDMRARLRADGIDDASIRGSPSGTLFRAPESDSVQEETDALPTLAGGPGPLREIRVGSAIGRGGMGLVCAARQASLQREVAVKLSVDRNSHQSMRELLREARITGRLSHPNVVPVYALGKNAAGDVLLVMKRIRGTPWSQRLQGGPRRGAELDEHLEIFKDVCRAVHFAHAEGVIHRDIKPANVMVGDFGEVYVLDWGLAATLRDDDDLGLPRADAIRHMAGTPSCMAPEMLTFSPPIGTHSDIFLLGGLLHHIVTGQPPWPGEDVAAVLKTIESGAEAGQLDGVPDEVAHLIKKALAPDPAARFSTADELRLAVIDLQKHESARQLVEQAEHRFATLLEEAQREGADDLEIERLFAECRFGYTQALTIAPGLARADEGQRRAYLWMAERAIGRGEANAARTWAAHVDEVPPELGARIAALEHKQAQHLEDHERLRAFAMDRSASVGTQGRALGTLIAGTSWATSALLVERLRRAGIDAALLLSLVGLTVAVAFLTISRGQAKRGSSNKVDLWVSIVAASLGALLSAHFAIAWYLAQPLLGPLTLLHVGVTMHIGGVAILFDRAMLLPSLTLAVTSLIIPFTGESALYWSGGLTLPNTLLVAWFILRRPDDARGLVD